MMNSCMIQQLSKVEEKDGAFDFFHKKLLNKKKITGIFFLKTRLDFQLNLQ